MIYYLNSWLQVGIIKILRKRPKSLLLFHELFISGVCYHPLCLKFSRERISFRLLRGKSFNTQSGS